MLEPLHDKVLIKKFEEEEKKVGSILLVGGSRDKYVKGTIVAVGEGRQELGHFIPTTVKVGEVVLFDISASSEVTIEGNELLLLRENAIMGKFKGDGK